LPAEKTHRVSERRKAQNRAIRTEARTLLKSAREAIASEASDKGADTVKKAVQAYDKTAGKGMVHPNTAARTKSRLMKRLNKAAK
jgi:small subunit ribosomal protein S20